MRCNLQMVNCGYLSVCAMFSKDARLLFALCFVCEAWLTNMDHVGVHVVTLFCFWSITFEGISSISFILLQNDQSSLKTGKVPQYWILLFLYLIHSVGWEERVNSPLLIASFRKDKFTRSQQEITVSSSQHTL